jgi:hypothetical protein
MLCHFMDQAVKPNQTKIACDAGRVSLSCMERYFRDGVATNNLCPQNAPDQELELCEIAWCHI